VLTSLVPMPKASAPMAPWVEVWLSPQTMVVPGSEMPCSGPMMWTMPCCALEDREYGHPEIGDVAFQRFDLDAAFLLGDAEAAVGGGMLWSAPQWWHPGGGPCARQAQALEGLRTGDLVDERAVDIEDAGAVGKPVHDMRVPDLSNNVRGLPSSFSSAAAPYSAAAVSGWVWCRGRARRWGGLAAAHHGR